MVGVFHVVTVFCADSTESKGLAIWMASWMDVFDYIWWMASWMDVFGCIWLYLVNSIMDGCIRQVSGIMDDNELPC